MFDIPPKIKNFLPRSITIHHKKTYIYGAPSSGKTSLALFHASKLRYVYYINFEMILSQDSCMRVRDFLLSLPNETELVIIDNFLPNIVDDIILNAPCIYIGKHEYCPKDFYKLRLLPLSFEEYLSFDRKNLSIETLLSNFIREGNNPEVYFSTDFKKRENKIRIMKLGLQENFLPFYYMLSLQSQKISTMGVYKHLKGYLKISKDRIYPLIADLWNAQIIHLCRHIDDNQKSLNKKYKIYFYDFSLSEFMFSKNFARVYENMVFLELLAMGFCLVYNDLCDFIDEKRKMIFLCTPFVSLEQIKQRIQHVQKREKKLSDFMVIAVSMNFNHQISNQAVVIDFTSLSLRFHDRQF